MKILWLCNIVLPELCEEFGFKRNNFGGWLTGMWHELQEDSTYELGICVPIRDPLRMGDGNKNGYSFFSFHATEEQAELLSQTERFKEILSVFQPDIVHIWGTEYIHSLSMLKACIECGMKNRVIVNIQGILSKYVCHYAYGLPVKLIHCSLNGRTIENEIDDFKKREKYEKAVLENINYVIGRTEWDKASVKQINPNIIYYDCGEILRGCFYSPQNTWNLNTCVKHRIFISQASYPIKGFHLILESLAKLSEQYCDLQVFVAGSNPLLSNTVYGNYICEQIKLLHLERVIHFLGVISDEMMYEQYMKANVFLSPSVIENSSNSVCEAMRVGTPVVSSYVGGIPSIIEHASSGYMYPLDESYMMEYYIKQIFDNPEIAMQLSQGARKRSEEYNNKKLIKKRMDEIYNIVFKKSNR